MMKTSSDGEVAGKIYKDRISDLPDSIIHQILSSFDMKDVVQTSVLSKRWRYVWKSHPFLHFDSNEICLSPFVMSEYKHFFSERRRKCKGFLDFVNKVIRFRDNNSSNIQSFHLNHILPLDEDDDHYNLKAWILIALRSNVKDLYLSLHGQDIFNQFPLFNQFPHDRPFTYKSLTRLELRNVNGDDPAKLNLSDSISLPRLKTLILDEFRFEHSANNIFSSRCFPVLESLTLFGCVFHETIGINISAPQLKHLVIIHYLHKYIVNPDHDADFDGVHDGDEYPIRLCSPNLLTFVCKDRSLSRDYLIENLPAIEEAEIGLGTDEYDGDVVSHFDDDIEEGRLHSQRMIKFLRGVQNVETLKLRAPFLKALSGDNAVLESTSIQLRNLRYLELETWLSVDCMNSITYLLNISPNVECLSLDFTRKDRIGNPLSIDSVLKEVQWETGLLLDRLEDVDIDGALGYEDELKFLEILLKKATVLELVTLYTPENLKKQQEEFVEKLRALPRAASTVKFMVL